MNESINEYLTRVTESLVTDACKKANFNELYKVDITRFLLAMSPMDRVLLIDSINRYDRDATLEWSRALQARAQKLDLADGISSTMKAEFEQEVEG